MTKQEQIEETANISTKEEIEARNRRGKEKDELSQALLHYATAEASGGIKSLIDCEGCAFYLYENLGYRKLPKDSVVLSKEEYEVLKIKEKEKHWFETCMSVWKNSKIDSSKETADKIFNDIIQALEERKDSVKEFYGVAESVGADVAIRAVKNLAKQFGVEIKE